MAAHDHLPTYKDLLFPTLRAVKELGGSAHVAEINEWIVEHLSVSDDDLSMTYPNRPDDSVYYDRMAWARSYDKLGGVLESPQRGLYLITALGRDIVSLPPEDAVSRLLEMDREVRRARQRKSDTGGLAAGEEAETDTDAAAPVDDEESEDSELRRMFLSRLHALSPSSFEDFVIFLLKSFGLELEPSLSVIVGVAG